MWWWPGWVMIDCHLKEHFELAKLTEESSELGPAYLVPRSSVWHWASCYKSWKLLCGWWTICCQNGKVHFIRSRITKGQAHFGSTDGFPVFVEMCLSWSYRDSLSKRMFPRPPFDLMRGNVVQWFKCWTRIREDMSSSPHATTTVDLNTTFSYPVLS